MAVDDKEHEGIEERVQKYKHGHPVVTDLDVDEEGEDIDDVLGKIEHHERSHLKMIVIDGENLMEYLKVQKIVLQK